MRFENMKDWRVWVVEERAVPSLRENLTSLKNRCLDVRTDWRRREHGWSEVKLLEYSESLILTRLLEATFFCLVGFIRVPAKNKTAPQFMLSTVTRCARKTRWPCYQNIPHRAQNLTKNTQKWHAHSRKYSQLPERNVVGVRNESS